MVTDEINKRLPPYVSYKTFDSLISKLRQYLPTRIDMSYLSDKFSISAGTQLMSAMSFLHLIDINYRPMPRLKLLASAATKEHRAALMRQVADDAYAFVLRGALDTQNASYNELADVFLNTYGMKMDVCRKCVNFFIDFCEDADIPLSTQITKARQNLLTIAGMRNTTDKWIGDDQKENEDGENPSDNRLQQVRFLNTLAKDFKHFSMVRQKSRQTLNKYKKIPKTMTSGEWNQVVEALSEYYKSAKFLYQIALLAELRIIDRNLLYVLYYAEIAENTTLLLSTLIDWCETGLDLAANYNSSDISHIAITLVNLIDKLNDIYQNHRGDVPFSVEVSRNFMDRKSDFFSNPSQFLENINRIVTIQ